jgi:hypothetical protein
MSLKRYTPLRTYTPLKRTGFLKRGGKPMKRASTKRYRQNLQYSEVRRLFLEAFPLCMMCRKLRHRAPHESTEVHHWRGRVGRLLCYTRFFVASCPECHDWVHANGTEARTLGFLAPAAIFNVYPKPGELDACDAPVPFQGTP